MSTTQTRKAGSDNKRYTSEAKVKIHIADRAVAWIALALVLGQMLFNYGLWSRYDLLRMFYEDIKTAIIDHGLNPHPHLPKENP